MHNLPNPDTTVDPRAAVPAEHSHGHSRSHIVPLLQTSASVPPARPAPPIPTRSAAPPTRPAPPIPTRSAAPPARPAPPIPTRPAAPASAEQEPISDSLSSSLGLAMQPAGTRSTFKVQLEQLIGREIASSSSAAMAGSSLNADYFLFLLNAPKFKEAINLNILGRSGFDMASRCFNYEYLKYLLDNGLERNIRLIFDNFFSQQADAKIAEKISTAAHEKIFDVYFGTLTTELHHFSQEQKVYMQYTRHYKLSMKGSKEEKIAADTSLTELVSLTDPVW